MSIFGFCFALWYFGRVPFLNVLAAQQLHGVMTVSDLSCFHSAIFYHAFTLLVAILAIHLLILGTSFDLAVECLRSLFGSLRCRLFLARLCGRSRLLYGVYARWAAFRSESIRRQAEELIRVNAEDAELNAAYLENAAFRA